MFNDAVNLFQTAESQMILLSLSGCRGPSSAPAGTGFQAPILRWAWPGLSGRDLQNQRPAWVGNLWEALHSSLSCLSLPWWPQVLRRSRASFGNGLNASASSSTSRPQPHVGPEAESNSSEPRPSTGQAQTVTSRPLGSRVLPKIIAKQSCVFKLISKMISQV